MECLLQYLDDVDDAFAMAGLFVEQVRRCLLGLLIYLSLFAVSFAAVWFAMVHPPLALASACLTFVVLLYRSVTGPVATVTRTA